MDNNMVIFQDKTSCIPLARPRLIVLAAFLVLLAGCQAAPNAQPKDTASSQQEQETSQASDERTDHRARLAASPGGSLILDAIEAAGGLQRWRQVESIAYEQTSTAYGSNGEVRTQTEKKVRIAVEPHLRVRIDYEHDGKPVALGYDGTDGWKTIDGKPELDRTARNHARNASFGAHFMLGLPFKLADPGTNYELLEEKDGFKRVRVTYEKSAGDAPMHVYAYRFEADTLRLDSAWISDPNMSVVVEYSDFHTIDGLTLATRRTRYGSNQKKERLERQAASKLENLRFGEEFDEDIFKEPVTQE